MYKQVPTWRSGSWTTTEFTTQDQFKDFLMPLFKEPGLYSFDETSYLFNEQARKYNKDRLFCEAPLGSKDYIKYWDDQKDKCRNGVIYQSDSETWYLPREYYMWLNFLPIYDKEEKLYGFAKVRDAQYHLALYELLAELHNKHVALCKKRQIASSYYHCAKLINHLWFEEGVTMKMGASHKDYVNEKGSWKFLNEYKSFLNEHTAWYRPMTPDKVLMWQQQVEITKGNRKSMKGLKGVIQGLTFDKSPTNGVGGGIRYFFYEEAGIAPTMGTTVEYLFPAMRSGQTYTGQFIAAGSVGDLDQCEPLKQMILYPEANDIYPVKTDLLDSQRTTGYSGLFIPEQWSMLPYIDMYGNSMVEQALESILEERIVWKKDLSPEIYQLRISQHPTNIAEAFAWRKSSIFPLHLVNAQLRRIEEKSYPYEYLELSRTAEGKIKAEPSNRLPIMEWPINPKQENKEGVLVVWERPIVAPNDDYPAWQMYYASIDPVGEGKTTTSDSLCSIYILKTPIQVNRIKSGETSIFMEQDKIVASWTGRYDDINKTYQMLENIIEWYNAWTVIENNVTGFIQYMESKRKLRYLAGQADMIFLKEAQLNQNVFQAYGWKNSGRIFKDNILSYGIEYLSEEIDQEFKPDGTVVKTTFGVERIPDPMLLKEMVGYQPGVNVDRLVAYCALIAFSRLQISHRGLKKRVEDFDKDLKKSNNLYKLSKEPFRFIGHHTKVGSMRPPRNPFKNIK